MKKHYLKEIVRCYNVIGIFKEDANELIEDLKSKYINKLDLKVEDIEQEIINRAVAKSEKNYDVADRIRKELDEKGIILNDSKEGTTWDIKELYV